MGKISSGMSRHEPIQHSILSFRKQLRALKQMVDISNTCWTNGQQAKLLVLVF